MASSFRTMLYGLSLIFICLTVDQAFASLPEKDFNGEKRKTELVGFDDEQALKRKRATVPPSGIHEENLTAEQYIPLIDKAWKMALFLEETEPKKVPDYYKQAASYLEARIKLLGQQTTEEDYILAAGINWMIALSLPKTHPEEASIFYEQAGDYFTKTRSKHNHPEIIILIEMLYKKALKNLKENEIRRHFILMTKLRNLTGKSVGTLEDNKYFIFNFTTGGKNFRLPFKKYDFDAFSELGIVSQKKEALYHPVPNVSVCLILANLLFYQDPLRAGQLYETAAQLQSHSLACSAGKLALDFRMIANLYWNANLLQGYRSLFKKDLFKQSSYFFEQWLKALREKATARDFEHVALHFSWMADLIQAQMQDQTTLIEEYKRKYRHYLNLASERARYAVTHSRAQIFSIMNCPD